MTAWKLVVVGVVCLAMCGNSLCIVPTSKEEFNPYEKYTKKLSKTADNLKRCINEWDITVVSRVQKDSYTKSQQHWDKVSKKLFDSIDKTITEMGGKKIFGIKAGFGGMAGTSQQLVKDVKDVAQGHGKAMYNMLKSGGIDHLGNKMDTRNRMAFIKMQKDAIEEVLNRFDPEKEGNDKTREVKKALASVLQSLQGVYEVMLDKISKKTPAKKTLAKK